MQYIDPYPREHHRRATARDRVTVSSVVVEDLNSSRSAGQSSWQAASTKRSTTARSLKTGNCTVTRGCSTSRAPSVSAPMAHTATK